MTDALWAILFTIAVPYLLYRLAKLTPSIAKLATRIFPECRNMGLEADFDARWTQAQRAGVTGHLDLLLNCFGLLLWAGPKCELTGRWRKADPTFQTPTMLFAVPLLVFGALGLSFGIPAAVNSYDTVSINRSTTASIDSTLAELAPLERMLSSQSKAGQYASLSETLALIIHPAPERAVRAST